MECVPGGVRCKLIVMQRKWDYTENHQAVMTTMLVHNHNYNTTTTNTTQPQIFKSRYSDWATGRTTRKIFALGRDKIIFSPPKPLYLLWNQNSFQFVTRNFFNGVSGRCGEIIIITNPI